jgi:hypothetical protein
LRWARHVCCSSLAAVAELVESLSMVDLVVGVAAVAILVLGDEELVHGSVGERQKGHHQGGQLRVRVCGAGIQLLE